MSWIEETDTRAFRMRMKCTEPKLVLTSGLVLPSDVYKEELNT